MMIRGRHQIAWSSSESIVDCGLLSLLLLLGTLLQENTVVRLFQLASKHVVVAVVHLRRRRLGRWRGSSLLLLLKLQQLLHEHLGLLLLDLSLKLGLLLFRFQLPLDLLNVGSGKLRKQRTERNSRLGKRPVRHGRIDSWYLWGSPCCMGLRSTKRKSGEIYR